MTATTSTYALPLPAGASHAHTVSDSTARSSLPRPATLNRNRSDVSQWSNGPTQHSLDTPQRKAHLDSQQHSSHHHREHSNGYMPSPFVPQNLFSFTHDPKSRPRGESDLGASPRSPSSINGYGFPSGLAKQDATGSVLSRPDSFVNEILSSVLLPLPFLLSSLIKTPNFTSSSASPIDPKTVEAVEEVASEALPIPARTTTLLQACALTSITLLVVGVVGRLRVKSNRKETRKDKPSTDSSYTDRFSLRTLRRLFIRMVCVGLPFLATVELGGVRTGTVLLTAAATGLLSPGDNHNEGVKSWKKSITSRKWTCLVFLLSLAYDLTWLRDGVDYPSVIRGYSALAKSTLFLRFPTPDTPPLSSKESSQASPVPFTASSTPSGLSKKPKKQPVSSLISTSEDVSLTLIAGLTLATATTMLSLAFSVSFQLSVLSLLAAAGSVLAAASLIVTSRPSSLRSNSKFGYGLGLTLCTGFGCFLQCPSMPSSIALISLSVVVFGAASLDSAHNKLAKKVKPEDGGHFHAHRHHDPSHASRFTEFLIHHTEDYPVINGVFRNKESRRIVYFMFINLGFMFVQTFYALVSGSLGLLSDSIHMFFDCIGLFAGLIASVMSKWPPSSKFPYGYGKVETLSGLGNGIFLMIISVEIIWESFERFMEGVELKHLTELLIVSVAGLLVNLIGLIFIGHAHHGHGHDHGGHDHSHHHNDSHADGVNHDHSHGHSHHEHENENIMGIYLHILADTMGSVAVIVSTILTAYTGWSGWDPIASFLIAVLIIAASYPLVVGSARRLLLTVPYETEYNVRETLQGISELKGVVGYAVPRFWLDDGPSHDHHEHGHVHSHGEANKHEHKHDHQLDHKHEHQQDGHLQHDHEHQHEHKHDHDAKECSENKTQKQKIIGMIHIIAARYADVEDVRIRTDNFLKDRNMHAVIQVEKEGQGRCWCGGEKGGGQGFISM